MKRIYFIYTGNYFALTGGSIYNRKIIENLRLLNLEISLVQLPDNPSDKILISNNSALQQISEIPTGSILLIDSLAFGSNYTLWKKYCHSHHLCPIVHLPLFLNPDFREYPSVKEKELDCFQFSRMIIVTSLYTKRLLQNEGIRGNKIHVVLPGVAEGPKKLFYPEKAGSFLCVSNVSPNKNQLMLLKVLNRLKEYDWVLHLVGSTHTDPVYFRLLSRFINENGLNGRIRFHGTAFGEQLDSLFLQADVFLFPSLFETYGMVIAEALKFGIPVFAYKSEGVDLNFKSYPLHLFRDESSLYSLISNSLNNKSFYSKIVSEIHSRRMNFITWENTAHVLAVLLPKL